MTALDYMIEQSEKHRMNLIRQKRRGAPADDLENIKEKIYCYEAAVIALEQVGELVRCQNCRYYHTDNGYCDFYGECSNDDNFCGNGERRNNDAAVI